MHFDRQTEWTLARYVAGEPDATLDALESPLGRALALSLRTIEQHAKHPALAAKPARHDALAYALRSILSEREAEATQSRILALDPRQPPPAEDQLERTIGEILADPESAPDFVVQNRIPVGLTILSGRPKVGKSWLILDLCATVAQGLPTLGVAPRGPAAVVYWALEDNWGRIQARAWKQGIPRDIPFHVRTKPARMPECLSEMREAYERYRPRLFVVDTLSRLIPPGASLNDSGEMTRALDIAQQMAFEYNAALILVHHQRKNNDGQDHLDAVLGATGITGAADAIYSLTRQRGEDTATLAITGRDIDAETMLGLSWDHEHCKWRVWEQGTFVAQRQPTLADLIQTALRELISADASQIAEKIGKDRSTVQTELKAMRERGELQAITAKGQGRRMLYSIPEIAPEVAEKVEERRIDAAIHDLTPEEREANRRAMEAAIEQSLAEIDGDEEDDAAAT